MSARKLLDELERQGLLDAAILADLRRQVEESKSRISAETVAKLLVDSGHLTKFQASRLVGEATAVVEEKRTKRSEERERKRTAPPPEDELGLAEPSPLEAMGAPQANQPKPKKQAPAAPAAPAGGLSPLEASGLQPLGGAPGGLQPLGGAPGGLQPLGGAPGGLAPLGGGLAPLGGAPGGLAPLDGGMMPLGGGMAPLGGAPLGGGMADPFANPTAPEGEEEAAPKSKKGGPKKKLVKESWESPILFFTGGGVLLLLVAGFFIYSSLTKGTAGEMFDAAEADYRGGSYTPAIDKYQKFLKKFPKDANASLARVRIGMSRIRQGADSSPEGGLKQATEQLPLIENEEAFDQARPELAGILPDVALKFAQQADKAQSIEEAEALLAQVDAAMALVNNPNYLPTNARKEQASRLEDIAKLQAKVRHEIGRSKMLAETIAEIEAAAEEGDTPRAYAARTKLIDTYPILEANAELQAAVRLVTQRQMSLVRRVDLGVTAANDDVAAGPAQRVLLSANSGRQVAAAAGELVLVRVEGAVYGIEVVSGKILWRRHVGLDNPIDPIPAQREPGADALVVDGSRNELLRLRAADGAVVWRLPIGEPLLPPVVSADQARITVALRSGRVFDVEAASGRPFTAAVLSQQLACGPGVGDNRRPLVYQPADHDNLFVLGSTPSAEGGEALECREVYYLQHKSGTVRVPPVMAVGHICVAVNAFPGRSQLHVLKVNDEGLGLEPAQNPIELEGHVVRPLLPSGRMLTVVTDLGAIYVFSVEPQKKDQPPVTPAAKPRTATFTQPTTCYALVDKLLLWTGDNRMSRFEVQVTKAELDQSKVENQGDLFVGPLHRAAGSVIHVRRPTGTPGVTLRAVDDKEIEQVIWQNELGVPAARIIADAGGVSVVSARGRLFPITPDAVRDGRAIPAKPPGAGDQGLYFRNAVELDAGRHLFVADDGRVLVYDPAARGELVERGLEGGGPLSAAPVRLGAGAVLPLRAGRVLLVDHQGVALAQPFQPRLQPGENITWRRPAVVGPDRFVIADGRQSLYLVAVTNRGGTALTAIQEQPLNDELVAPLAAVGGTVYSAIRGANADVLLSFSADKLEPGAQMPLQGRVTHGPSQDADAVFVATTGDGLICLDASDKIRWRLPLTATLVDAPRLDGESYLIATVDGQIARVDRASGRVLEQTKVDEPLSAGPAPFKGRALVATADGTLLVATLRPVAAAEAVTAGGP